MYLFYLHLHIAPFKCLIKVVLQLFKQLFSYLSYHYNVIGIGQDHRFSTYLHLYCAFICFIILLGAKINDIGDNALHWCSLDFTSKGSK